MHKNRQIFICLTYVGKFPLPYAMLQSYLVSSFQAKIVTLFTTQTSCVVQYVYFLI
nr:MAG TPA: hypothetical protein [Caudoviricetes sp.]